MTFQPPPPPPGGTPPPPPPGGQFGPPPGGQYGPPPGGGQYGPPGNQPARGGFDPKTVNTLDWTILGAGVLAFIFSFINFFTYSGKGALASAYSVDQSAWSGFVTLLAMLLVLAGIALVAIELFAPQVKLPVPTRLAALGAFALSTLLMIIALFFVPDYGGGGPGYDAAVDEGHGFGYWACLILIIAATVLSLMRLQQTGGQLPGALAGMPNIGGRTGTAPHGGHGATGGPTPPPPPGYGPPQ